MTKTKTPVKRGREVRPKEEHRRNKVMLYLLDKEYEALKRAAQERNAHKAVLARELVLDGIEY